MSKPTKMNISKKILLVLFFEIVVYLLAYLVDLFLMTHFDLDGDIWGGGWFFYEIIGGYMNLLVTPLLTALLVLFLSKSRGTGFFGYRFIF